MEELLGFLSVVLDKHKKPGYLAKDKRVLNHFKNHIRESYNITIHFTDSQPCVLAWRRSRQGAFSSSSRIAAFLTGLSELPIELRHKAGKTMYTSDYASRHPSRCTSDRCQICNFAKEWQDIGDNSADIRSISIEDIKSGKALMPMTQKKVWRSIQMKDPIHCKLRDLIQTRQLPEAKKRNGDSTKLKLLHNIYTQGKLIVEDDGLVMIKSPEAANNGLLLSVPPSLFPGIANAFHLRLDHPSKAQLTSLMARYFYAPGWRAIIAEVSDNCHQCATLRKLPKVLLEDSSTTPEKLASNFSADVIEREGQKILVVREGISQYTKGIIIKDQTAETLRNALLTLVIDLIPDSGTEIRVDGATAFQALERESITNNSLLKKMGIKITVGRLLNKNKNPTAENAVKEIQKEILRLKNTSGQITPTELSLVMKNVNSRMRFNGYTPREILFRRNNFTNLPMEINDQTILNKQMENRANASEASRKHNSLFRKPSPTQNFNMGDLVLLRNHVEKNKPRDTFLVEDFLDEGNRHFILIRKVSKLLKPRLYKALPEELILCPGQPLLKPDFSDVQPEEPVVLDGYKDRQPTLPIDTRPELKMPTSNLEPRRCRRRSAAIKAEQRMKNMVTLVKERNTKKKHGWEYADQIEEELLFFRSTNADDYIIPEDVSLSTNPTTDTEDTLEDSSAVSDNDDNNMVWDTSPEQYTLQASRTYVNSSYAPNPRSSTPRETPSRRPRAFATSHKPVQRSHAFKTHSPNQAFIATPTTEVLNNPSHALRPNHMTSGTSRIPKPTSPGQVNLQAVNDISLAAPQVPFSPRRSTRNTRQPTNYQRFHRLGRADNGEDEEERATKTKKNER